MMAAYKEPLEVMIKTIDTLKAQTVARQIFFVVAFEERTPEVTEKSAELQRLYGSAFFHMLFTRHPYGVEGEIPGKCSNANYSAREAIKRLTSIGVHNLDACTFTTCDTDNLFPANYLERLGDEFVRCGERRHEVIWQPPLFYNYDLDRRPFFVRVTGILRMVFVIGMLIPQNINAMSVYSMSVRLLMSGEHRAFFHPGYQFVDAIDNLIRMIALGRHVPLKLLLCPVISGPTSGVDFHQEIIEWARQAWRWTIGTTEIFHYFCIKCRSLSFGAAFAYGVAFTHYYGFVLCSMALFAVSGIVATNAFNAAGVCTPSAFLPSVYLTYIPLVGLGFVYLMFVWCFVLDAIATRYLLGVSEDIGVARNVVHWASTPFVLLAYSAIGYFAVVELAVRGKKVCTHGASKKQGLAVEKV